MAEPPQATTQSRPRFPSPLRRSLYPPEDLPDSRRSRGCSDAPGPADLLAPSGPCDGAPRPGAGLRMGDSMVAPYAAARWAFCCDLQCVGGAVWPIDSSNIETHTSENLICIGWDGGNKEAKVTTFLGLREAGTQNACACCSDPTSQLNKLSPMLGFGRNRFMSLRSWHVLLACPVSCGVRSIHQILRQQCCRTG